MPLIAEHPNHNDVSNEGPEQATEQPENPSKEHLPNFKSRKKGDSSRDDVGGTTSVIPMVARKSIQGIKMRGWPARSRTADGYPNSKLVGSHDER